MKFTNGYWLTKPEYDLHFAIESYSATITEKSLRIICPSVSVRGRGDILNHATLTVTFSSPMEDVIRVSVEHFRGVVQRGPYFDLKESPVIPEITETDEAWTFRSGRAAAVSTRPSSVSASLSGTD